MKFDGVRVSASYFDALLRSTDKASYERLDELRQLWAWRLRLGRENLSEAERDIHVVAEYADEVDTGIRYEWQCEERVGHPAFFARNPADVERAVRMLGVLSCASVARALREAQAMLPPWEPTAPPPDSRLAIEGAIQKFNSEERRRMRQLDHVAAKHLPGPSDFATALLSYAAEHADEIIVPERSQPPLTTAVPIESKPPVEDRRPAPRLDATWESVRHEQPGNAPAYGSGARFTPGSWLSHPKLGNGYVVDVNEGKLRVLFETGERKLAVP